MFQGTSPKTPMSSKPIVVCPGCRVQMRAVKVEPKKGDTEEITYQCPKCGTETKRRRKSD